MNYDDGRSRPGHGALLAHADLQDQMSMRYLPGRDYPIPTLNFEPGRVRHEPFFRKMYGDSAKAVGRTLTRVVWMPSSAKRPLLVTRGHGIDKVGFEPRFVSERKVPVLRVVVARARHG